MNMFKLGIRSFFGLLIPGIILVVLSSYTIWRILILFELTNQDYLSMLSNGNPLLVFTVGLAISYMFGNFVRMGSAEEIDEKSGKLLVKKYFQKFPDDADFKMALDDTKISLKYALARKGTPNWQEFEDIVFNKYEHIFKEENSSMSKKAISKRKAIANSDKDFKYAFDEWLRFSDKYPYRIWEFRRFKIFYPENFFKFFYEKYRHPILADNKKAFLNYCKSSILHKSDTVGDSLKEKIQSEEATSKFFSSSYFTFKYALWILTIALFFQFSAWMSYKEMPIRDSLLSTLKIEMLHRDMWYSEANFIYQFFQNLEKSSSTRQQNNSGDNQYNFTNETSSIFHLILICLCMLIIYSMKEQILKNFRFIRLREIAAIYDAFFLLHSSSNIAQPSLTYTSD